MKLHEVHPLLQSLLHPDSAAVPSVLALDDPAWDTIFCDATRHGLIPLLHRTARLPPSVRNRLKAAVAQMAARNLVFADELLAILRACHARSIACVPLRGLALAERLYGENSIRPTGDIDLLVRWEDIPVVTGILTGLGYVGMEHRPGFASSFSYTLEFVKDRHGWVVVEPHWTLAYPPFAKSLDMEQVWTRCRKGHVAGLGTLLLGDEDLLAHQCFHVLHHGEKAPLLWWYELDLLIRQTGTSLDWSAVAGIVKRAGQAFFVTEVLETLRGQFQTPIPPSALANLAVRTSVSLMMRLMVHAPYLDGREEFSQLVFMRGIHAKARYALGLLFPTPAYMIRRYGVNTRIKLATAYVTRLFHLGWEGLRWMYALLSAAFAAKVPFPR
jgi:putative nucleotidyltransferase-like protein